MSVASANAPRPRVPSLSERARQGIEKLIFDGALLPGAALDERALAERFAMSRTPVREAIQQLQVEGLVHAAPRQGACVIRLSIRELLSMFELLAELEASCTRFATRRIKPAARKALTAAAERCQAEADRADFMAYEEANAAFHQVLYTACCNRYLTDQIASIRRRTGVYRRNLFENTGRLQESAADHQRIAAAVIAGDERLAEETARSHIVVGGKGFADYILTIPDGLVDP